MTSIVFILNAQNNRISDRNNRHKSMGFITTTTTTTTTTTHILVAVLLLVSRDTLVRHHHLSEVLRGPGIALLQQL